MSRAKTKTRRLRKQQKKANSLINTGFSTATETASALGEELRQQVTGLDIPGKVADLDLPTRLQDARRELAGRIDPGPAPKRKRRKLLWIGLFLTALGATAWAVLARRPSELEPLAPPAPSPAPNSTSPVEPVSSNGTAPSSSTSQRQ